MRTKPITIGVAGIVIFFLVAMLVNIARPGSLAITARHVSTNRSPVYGITQTFEVTNHATDNYTFYPTEIEVRTGAVWTTCCRFEFQTFRNFKLGPNECVSFALETPKLPEGCALRLRLVGFRQLKGLAGLPTRLSLRFRYGGALKVPLNPFDKSSWVSSKTIPFLSDEFVVPAPK